MHVLTCMYLHACTYVFAVFTTLRVIELSVFGVNIFHCNANCICPKNETLIEGAHAIKTLFTKLTVTCRLRTKDI